MSRKRAIETAVEYLLYRLAAYTLTNTYHAGRKNLVRTCITSFPWRPQQRIASGTFHSSNLLTVARIEVKLGAHEYYNYCFHDDHNNSLTIPHMEMKLGTHAYYIVSMKTTVFSIINFYRGLAPFTEIYVSKRYSWLASHNLFFKIIYIILYVTDVSAAV